jgi:hypothetical protein
MNDEEIWKDIVGYEGTYEVSMARRVRRITGGQGARAGRILRPAINSRGCPTVTLYLCGKRTTRLISHLVADAFLPKKAPTDTVVRHLNDNPADNRLENLAWGTYSDNRQDAIRNDRLNQPIGVAHWNARLTEDNVREIRRLYATGEFSYQELGLRFGVSKQMVSSIVHRRNWKHVT